MSDLEPSGVHTSRCAVWVSADPVDECTCGAGQWPYITPEPDNPADRIDQETTS